MDALLARARLRQSFGRVISMDRFWLGEQLPELADDLDAAFRDIGREDLADCVWHTEIIEPCPCDSETCGTFYTVSHRIWTGKVERFFDLKVEGLICVHVENGQIAWVELLNRPDICKQLIRMFSYGLSDDEPDL